jgi:hypothetical protein
MRIYGRKSGKWVEVSTQAGGSNDYVYITSLIQCLLLITGESPFYANFGIPAQQSIIQQVFPDFYVALIQQYFSQFFAVLQISKVRSTTPTYNVNITTNDGTKVQVIIPV